MWLFAPAVHFAGEAEIVTSHEACLERVEQLQSDPLAVAFEMASERVIPSNPDECAIEICSS